MQATQALEKLKQGNLAYVQSCKTGNVSPQRRQQTASGQSPYAVVVGCADSRVIPETVFCAGIGEIFTVRLAGNVVDDGVLGSIQYATEHLGCNLVVVLGHEGCGAVHAALSGGASGYTHTLVEKICQAIGNEHNPTVASKLNAQNSARQIQTALPNVTVVAALYCLETGLVQFL